MPASSFKPRWGTMTTSPPSTIRRSTCRAGGTTPTFDGTSDSSCWTRNVLDAAQLTWAETALQQSTEAWKIAYFHHPLYGNAGRHGSNVDVRVLLEPLLVKYGVHVVFSGHDHVYERLKPQRGIHYFVAGSGGQLRKGDLQKSDITAAGFDQDQAFMLVEIAGDEMHFQVVSRTGVTVDSGQIPRLTTRIGT